MAEICTAEIGIEARHGQDYPIGVLGLVGLSPYIILKSKVRKSGTGYVYQINDTLWEGSFFPRLPDGKRKKFNVYAKTREECEAELAKMIEQKKKEIAKLKKKAKTA